MKMATQKFPDIFSGAALPSGMSSTTQYMINKASQQPDKGVHFISNFWGLGVLYMGILATVYLIF